MYPVFSVIIPTFNRPEFLKECLKRLAPGRQSIESYLFEVIVTDDGKEGVSEIVCAQEFPFVRYTYGPGKGPAANRNHGAALARGEWFLFTDDDCLPDSDWIKSYIHAIEKFPGTQAFEGAILPDDPKLLKKDLAECPVNENGGCFWSANIMISSFLFRRLGGFDEQFKIAAQEDQDLLLRIKMYTLPVFIKQSVVIHPVRIVSLIEQLKTVSIRMQNWIIYYDRHGFNPPLPRKFLLSFFYYLKLTFISVINGLPRKALLQLRYSVECLHLFFKWRRRVN